VAKNGLAYPRLRVIMADGGEWEIQPIGPDQILWETTAVKHKWPEFTRTPVTWQTFLAWAASRREGLVPTALTWETFRAQHQYVQAVDQDTEPAADDQADDDELDPADVPPTRPGVGTG
jgi:hypothetical protein